MENLTKEEQELIADLHALRRVNFPRYASLLEAFDGVIKYEANHPPHGNPQPEPAESGKVIPFPSSQRIPT